MRDLEAVKKERDTADRALKAKWSDNYAGNVALAERALAAFPEPLKKAVAKIGAANDPAVIELVYLVGQAMAEGKLRTGDPGGGKRPIAERLYGGTKSP
jgi:hypothetical protein